MGKLYLVATPIGNLGDITARALETLKSCDFIAAEDTRVTQKLLNHFEIKKPLVSYYEHNRTESGARILERLLQGESCALVSDAGTPVISDPGFDLVALCAESNIGVESIPGACAAVAGLTLSALPAGRFTFEGFLSVNRRARKKHLDELKDEKRTMVFYEAPHKLLSTLHDMSEVFGDDRRIAVCRELTKLHEEILHTTVGAAAAHFEQNSPRGEFVLVIEGAAKRGEEPCSLEEGVLMVLKRHESGASLPEAAREVSRLTGLNKNKLYSSALSSKN